MYFSAPGNGGLLQKVSGCASSDGWRGIPPRAPGSGIPIRRATLAARLPTPIAVLGFGPAPFRNHFDANIPLKRLKPRLQGFLCADEGLKGCRVVRHKICRQHAVAPALEPDFGSGEDIAWVGVSHGPRRARKPESAPRAFPPAHPNPEHLRTEPPFQPSAPCVRQKAYPTARSSGKTCWKACFGLG